MAIRSNKLSFNETVAKEFFFVILVHYYALALGKSEGVF